MANQLANMQSFPFTKKQLLISANIFFWICFIFFDAITTAGMVNGFFVFTFQRAIAHALILFFLVYPNLYWLYPRYFSKGRHWKYAMTAIALLALNVVLRTGLDSLYLQWFLGGNFYNTQTGQEAFQTIVDSGFMRPDFRFSFSYYFGMTLGSIGVFFITTPIKLVEDWYEKQRLSFQLLEDRLKLNETKMKFLKAQTDPHFLINALSGVYNLALLQSDKIDFAILRLSELMGYLLGHGKKDFIALRYEIDFIQNFIDFHKAINPEPIQIEFLHNATSVQLENIALPPMLIQPFFENALKHGNADDDPEGWIKSALKVEAQQLHFFIENSLKVRKGNKNRPSFNVGLQNIQERLKMYFLEDGYNLKMETIGEVYRVELMLNLEKLSPLPSDHLLI